ncbi:MAG: hypothetical protein ABFD49_07230 [Armatimonadota bacterium]|nr:hypothetical protein [bacterium]
MKTITERKSVTTSQRILEAAGILAVGVLRARRRKTDTRSSPEKTLDFSPISSINLNIPSVHGGQI